MDNIKEIRATTVSKLSLKDGDVLCVTLGSQDLGGGLGPWIPTQEDVEATREAWEDVLPSGVKVIVTHIGTELTQLEIN